jgi:di/tricarboxylate transporter
LDVSQGGQYTNITFLMWMGYIVPPTIVNLLIAWAYLLIRFQGITALKNSLSSEHKTVYKWKTREVNLYLKGEYEKLGRISYHQYAVGFCFILVILCWIFRDPDMFPGWGDINTGAKSGDSTGAMFGLLLLFIIPKCWKFLLPRKNL